MQNLSLLSGKKNGAVQKLREERMQRMKGNKVIVVGTISLALRCQCRIYCMIQAFYAKRFAIIVSRFCCREVT